MCNSNNAKTIVRLTADCPLVDPKVVDQVIEKFICDEVDYCAIQCRQSIVFPDGSDVEVFSLEALQRAYTTVNDAHFVRKVTFQFWRNQGIPAANFHMKEIGQISIYS